MIAIQFRNVIRRNESQADPHHDILIVFQFRKKLFAIHCTCNVTNYIRPWERDNALIDMVMFYV